MKKNIILQFGVLFILLFTIKTQLSGITINTNYGSLQFHIKSSTNTIWSLWDDINTHNWFGHNWSAPVTLTWSNYHGRNCLRVIVSNTAGTATGYLQTDQYFYSENWNSPITGIRMDVFCGTNVGTQAITLESHASNGTQIQHFSTTSNGIYNNWKEIGWDFTGDYSKMAMFYIIFENLDAIYTPHTYFINNIRIVSNGKEIPWDIMSQSHDWGYWGQDGWDAEVDWNPNAGGMGNLIPITHNNTSPSNSVGSLFMQWDNSVDTSGNPYAKVQANSMNENWSLYSSGKGKISAMVYCSATNHIVVHFYDNNNGDANTEDERVSAINNWQTITWTIPAAAINWANLTQVYFIIKTDSGSPTGTIYINHIKRGW